MHSLIVDRGTEFSGLGSFEPQYGIKTYYCHAYSPAERGSNKRFNRHSRYFYPKGTCFKHVSAHELTTYSKLTRDHLKYSTGKHPTR